MDNKPDTQPNWPWAEAQSAIAKINPSAGEIIARIPNPEGKKAYLMGIVQNYVETPNHIHPDQKDELGYLLRTMEASLSNPFPDNKMAMSLAKKYVPGLVETLRHIPKDQRMSVLVDGLLSIAADKDDEPLFYATAELTKGKKEVPLKEEPAVDISGIYRDRFETQILETRLAEGDTISEAIENHSREVAVKEINRLVELSQGTFQEKVINSLRNSMQSHRDQLQQRVDINTEEGIDQDQIDAVEDKIRGIDRNLQVIARMEEKQADYDNAQDVLVEISAELVDEEIVLRDIVDGNIPELRKQEKALREAGDIVSADKVAAQLQEELILSEARAAEHGPRIAELIDIRRGIENSIKPQIVTTVKRRRQAISDLEELRVKAAHLYLRTQENAGHTQDASRILAYEILPEYIPPTKQPSEARILKNIRPADRDKFRHLYTLLKDRGIPGDLDQDFLTFYEQVAITHREHPDAKTAKTESIKARLMEIMSPALSRMWDVDLGELTRQANKASAENPPIDCYYDVLSSHLMWEARNRIAGWFDVIVHQSSLYQEIQAEDIEGIQGKVVQIIGALFDLERYQLDPPMHPSQLIKELSQAVIQELPLMLSYVKSHRWHYPDGTIDVTPDADDFWTKTSTGEPILRREETDKGKLDIVNKRVVAPLLHHGIPLKEILVVQPGEEQVAAFGFTENDDQFQNALSYVLDLRDKVSKWAVFPEDIETSVISFRQLAEAIDDNMFKTLVSGIRSMIDYVETHPGELFMGINDMELERLVDAEYDKKGMFVRGWTRERSREYVKRLVSLNGAVSVLLSMINRPHIVVMMGSANSNRMYKWAHQIVDDTEPNTILSVKSVNDGEVHSAYKDRTDVV